ncbi:hypothetical protein BOTCAL_0169g00080 [Botryotinia calthae]|uniref:Uncharacterized protein n=1 Tax=Botryotinia calthae TaxID=38488 RepID=A0A4Y8D1C5_9HELO|nr:hypothetical protein BOTCAL_0169g00080 [Botryotinia calthae]
MSNGSKRDNKNKVQGELLPQANNNTSCFDVTFNPQYRSGTSGSGQHSSSAQQESHVSIAMRSNGNGSHHSSAGAQRDNASWNVANSHAQDTRTSAWNGRNQPGAANFQRDGRGGYQ